MNNQRKEALHLLPTRRFDAYTMLNQINFIAGSSLGRQKNDSLMINVERYQARGPYNEEHADLYPTRYHNKRRKKRGIASCIDSHPLCSSPNQVCKMIHSSIKSENEDENIDFSSKRQRISTKESPPPSAYLDTVDKEFFASFEFLNDIELLEPIDTLPSLISTEQAPLPFNQPSPCDIDGDILDALIQSPPLDLEGDEINPGDNDIILGRGKGANTHAGNIKFREIVEKRKPLYHKLGRSNTKKKAFTLEILQSIKNDGGRFLELGDIKTGAYREVSDEKAREKISQRLREPSSR